MSRFYVPKDSVNRDTIVIGGDEAHHIVDVMRLKPFDTIVAFDGTGREYAGSIRSVKRGSVVIEIIRVIEPSRSRAVRITLIQAIPKKAKMDYIVEKATELGVRSIIPVITERTVPDWDQEKRLSSARRWRKIALEASKQSSRSEIPEVADIKDFVEVIGSAGKGGIALIPTLGEGLVSLKDAITGYNGDSATIAIGPEGDFTPGEVKSAEDAGFRAVSLGSRVLKSDTAGLAVLAILDYELSR